MFQKYQKLIYYLIVFLCFPSCAEDFGNGGDSMISGKIFCSNNSKISSANGINVYILYMEAAPQCISVTANKRGEFKFMHLKTGDYSIFVYENEDKNNIPKLIHITISEKSQTLQLADMVIYN
jgi:hypothetical protein